MFMEIQVFRNLRDVLVLATHLHRSILEYPCPLYHILNNSWDEVETST